MKISIFGTGYVGLVTGVCLAEIGHEIVCVDVDAKKIAQLQQAISPIYEPGLTELLQRNLANQRLQFTTDSQYAIQQSHFIFIAVGTPSDEDGSADLSSVLKVAQTIGQNLTETRIIINKSTVPVGSADKVTRVINEELKKRGQTIKFAVVSNPEFLREGSAIKDFMQPDRIVIGANSDVVIQDMLELYSPLKLAEEKLITMDIYSAELTKYAANAMLATKISFINELSNIADKVGADIENIRRGIGSDPRIGPLFLNAGCGFGGSCFPKDLAALANIAERKNYYAQLIQAVMAVNQRQKIVLVDKVKKYFGDLSHKTIAVWGLAFKPDTDDMREASSRVFIEAMWQANAKVRAYDPVAMLETERLYGKREDFVLCADKFETLHDADALVICTEWSEFKQVNLITLHANLKNPVIFDGRNIFDPQQMQTLNFQYFPIGRNQQLAYSAATSIVQEIEE